MNLPIFSNGQQGSASELMSALQYLHDLGQTSLTNLTDIRTQTLLSFERRVSYLNSKQQTANKLINENSLVNFAITDFSNIDQSETTATVRIDASVVTSSEQSLEVEAIISSLTFNSSVGSVETLNSNSNIYRVYDTNNITPTGTFSIVLREAINLSVVIFDLPSVASNPTITVSVSDTNVIYTPCLSYSLNGSRLIVYLPPAEIKYIKLTITPSHPDNLGGSLFTFGLTNFVGSSTQYRLLSEFVTKPVTFNPKSVYCKLSGVPTDGLLYFLSLNGLDYSEVDLDTIIPIPNTDKITNLNTTLDGTGLLSQQTTAATYLTTLSVIDNSTGLSLPIVYGISPIDPLIANIDRSYVSVVGNNLYYIPYISADSSKTFTVSFVEGPVEMTAQLKVQISTNDRNLSPIFNGVVLLTA